MTRYRLTTVLGGLLSIAALWVVVMSTAGRAQAPAAGEWRHYNADAGGSKYPASI